MKFLDDTRIPNHPYSELREVLKVFVTEIKAELAENFVGIYLVGSLATGDFDLDSDVDFLVVTDNDLTPYFCAKVAHFYSFWAKTGDFNRLNRTFPNK